MTILQKQTNINRLWLCDVHFLRNIEKSFLCRLMTPILSDKTETGIQDNQIVVFHVDCSLLGILLYSPHQSVLSLPQITLV